VQQYIDKHPAIAILRGVLPNQVIEVAQTLYTHGLRVIEVPLNSERALFSIEQLAKVMPAECLVGAGTVTCVAQAQQVANSGGKVIISPHCDAEIIKYCCANKLMVVAGIATPTEAFTAYHAGARWLKLFPASTYGINHLNALRSVLPADAKIIAVGGINAANAQQWLASGANALGLGNSLYKAGDDIATVNHKITLLNAQLATTLP